MNVRDLIEKLKTFRDDDMIKVESKTDGGFATNLNFEVDAEGQGYVIITDYE